MRQNFQLCNNLQCFLQNSSIIGTSEHGMRQEKAIQSDIDISILLTDKDDTKVLHD